MDKSVYNILYLSSWGLVQPGILSVPELCHHLAEAWVSIAVLTTGMIQYKRLNPGKVRTTPDEEKENLILYTCICLHMEAPLLNDVFNIHHIGLVRVFQRSFRNKFDMVIFLFSLFLK